jgi:exopolysaccharide biosynthesis polyprenyl glycosylphosphotransferase
LANRNRVIVLPESEPTITDYGNITALPRADERGAELWERRLVVAVLAVDVCALLAAIGIAEVIRMSGPRTPTSLFRDLLLTGTVFVAWLGALFLNRAYEPRFLGLGAEEYKRVFRAGTALLAGVATLSYADMAVTGRTLVVVALPLATAFALVGRYAVRGTVVRARARGRCMHRVVVVGSPEGVADFVAVSRKAVDAGLHVVGCCLPEALMYDAEARARAGVPLLGSANDVRRATLVSGATTIAITSSGAITGGQLRRLAWDLEGTGIDILVAPALTDIAGPRIHLRPVAGLPLIHLEEPEFDGGRQTVKGAVDRVAALAALVLMTPVLAVVSLLVASTSPGPVLFRQTRVGRNGKPFTMLKFRSMSHDAERHLAALQVANENADGLLFKIKADPRVTPIGKILRRFSLDELPQLINVLRGEMSLVGPRPPLETEVAQYGEDTARRLLVKPGLTGLWQISGRSDLPWDEAVRLDLHYVENWSIALDCLILWKTAFAVFARRGAY